MAFRVAIQNVGFGRSIGADLTLLEDLAPYAPEFIADSVASTEVPPLDEDQQVTVVIDWNVASPGRHSIRFAVHFGSDTTDQTEPEFFTTLHSQPLVIITEFLANPSDGPGEWVEISNQANFAIDMISTRLGDAEESSALPGLAGTISPGTYWVLAQDEAAFRSFYPAFDGLIIQVPTWRALNNDGDQIRLIGAAGEIIDSVRYDRVYDDNRSVERLTLSPTFAAASDWTGSVDPSGATPGRDNSVNRDLAGTLQVSVSPNPIYLSRTDVAQIEYRLEIGEQLTLEIYDRAGQLVKTVAHEIPAATGMMTWDGTDDDGGQVRPGPYILLARSDPKGTVRKEVIVVGP